MMEYSLLQKMKYAQQLTAQEKHIVDHILNNPEVVLNLRLKNWLKPPIQAHQPLSKSWVPKGTQTFNKACPRLSAGSCHASTCGSSLYRTGGCTFRNGFRTLPLSSGIGGNTSSAERFCAAANRQVGEGIRPD